MQAIFLIGIFLFVYFINKIESFNSFLIKKNILEIVTSLSSIKKLKKMNYWKKQRIEEKKHYKLGLIHKTKPSFLHMKIKRGNC